MTENCVFAKYVTFGKDIVPHLKEIYIRILFGSRDLEISNLKKYRPRYERSVLKKN